MLASYDTLVLGVANHLIWGCPTQAIQDHYARHVGRAHVEIGPGTGYMLDRVSFPIQEPQITLVDVNSGPLTVAGRRLARYRPRAVRADVLRPLPLPPGTADSVALTYVLHCLPGGFAVKQRAIAHAARLTRDGGWVFGATVLSGGVRHTPHSRAHQALLNATGVFHNTGDDLENLHHALQDEFDEVEVSTRGAVALFAARGGHRPSPGAAVAP
jgi:ubiquinone/menaquinone biosynthesis C-methylase UbiE